MVWILHCRSEWVGAHDQQRFAASIVADDCHELWYGRSSPAGKLTAGRAESNGSLPPVLWPFQTDCVALVFKALHGTVWQRTANSLTCTMTAANSAIVGNQRMLDRPDELMSWRSFLQCAAVRRSKILHGAVTVAYIFDSRISALGSFDRHSRRICLWLYDCGALGLLLFFQRRMWMSLLTYLTHVTCGLTAWCQDQLRPYCIMYSVPGIKSYVGDLMQERTMRDDQKCTIWKHGWR